jgi:hypothetical protein
MLVDGALGALIQWWKALPLGGNANKFKPVMTVALVCAGGYFAYWLQTPDALAHGMKAFFNAGLTNVLTVGGWTQVASSAAQFAVNNGAKPSHALVPVSTN